MKLSFTKYSDVGLVREQNEDNCGIKFADSGVLAVVCDGVGGNIGGEVASSLAVSKVIDAFLSTRGLDYSEKIFNVVQAANLSIYNKSKEDWSLRGMASTLVMTYIKGNSVYWGHVGDSRIYALINNELKQITKDHSLVEEMVEKGILTPEEAAIHPKKNIITRALGSSEMVKVDFGTFELKEEDKNLIFLCTDGVSGVVDHNTLAEFLSSYDSHLIVKNLYNYIRANGAPDNFTFALITNIQ